MATTGIVVVNKPILAPAGLAQPLNVSAISATFNRVLSILALPWVLPFKAGCSIAPRGVAGDIMEWPCVMMKKGSLIHA